jgi:hypothetical protein
MNLCHYRRRNPFSVSAKSVNIVMGLGPGVLKCHGSFPACRAWFGETRGVERTRIEFRKFIGCPSFPGWGGYDSPSGVSGSFHSLGILEIKPRPYRRLTQLLYSLFGS